MDMKESFYHFLENFSNPFFVGSLTEKKVLYVNKGAEDIFGYPKDTCNFEKIFQKSEEPIVTLMEEAVGEKKNKLIYNVTATTSKGEQMLVDVHFGFFKEEGNAIFLEVIPQQDTRLQMTMYQIDQSHRPEVLLNLDNTLSIIHCNEAFHEVFESSEELRHSHFKNDLVNGFLPEGREELMASIVRGLAHSAFFSTKIKVCTVTGDERWYLLEMEKRILDTSKEEKIFAYMTNIEMQMEVEEQFAMTNQYLSVLQKSTVDILYRVDVVNMVMYHYSDFTEGVGQAKVIYDYVSVFTKENIVHPDDVAYYLQSFQDFYEKDIEPEEPVRFSFDGRTYQWYKITAQKIFNRKGELTEVFGALVNVENEQKIKEQVSSINQYFEGFQSVSDESFYVINLEERTLLQKGKVSQELGLEGVVQNFPRCLYDLVQPEDLSNFIAFTNEALDGDTIRVQTRLKTKEGEYQWYELRSQGIRDDKGTVTELIGKINNIHKQKAMQQTVSSLHKYIEATQSMSGESLYFVDLKTRILRQKGDVAVELGFPEEISNFPEGVYPYIHPDELEHYKDFVTRSLQGEDSIVQVRVKTVQGEYRWYEIISRIIRDDFGTMLELFGRMTNIQQKHELESKVEEANKYLEIMQELTTDVLYRIDMKTMTLYYTSKTNGTVTTHTYANYPESALAEGLVHPDDGNSIREQTKEWLSGNMVEYKLRMKLVTDDYEWYSDSAMVTYDDEGNIAGFFGRLKNIHREEEMKAEVSIFNKYFDAAQEFTSDILYRIDVATQTLYHSYQSDRALEVGTTIPNYLETIVKDELVHPDDADMYIENTKLWLIDERIRCEARFNIVTYDYQWYSIARKKIYDAEGNLIEILGALVSIHKERELEEKFEASSQYFEIMQELSDDIYYRVEVDTLTLHHNLDTTQPITQRKEIPDYVSAFIQEKVIHPEDVESYIQQLEAFNKGITEDVTARFALLSDEYHWYRARAKKIYDENGKVVEYWGRLISEQKEKVAKELLSEVSQYFSAMQKLSDDILFHIDIATKTFSHTDQNALNFGVPAEIPNYVEAFIENGMVRPEDADLYREYTEKLFSGELMSYQLQVAVDIGVYEWFDVKCEFIYDSEGKAIEIFGKMQNIQKKKTLEERAYHDMMTGALNKATFEEEASKVLEATSIELSQQKHALIFIDLDDFKGVNDNLGHSCGDTLLATVGSRLRKLVRGNDLVGRIGGDEFAVMLRNVDNDNSVLVRTNIMLQSLQETFSCEGNIIGIKASVGVAVSPDHGTTYKELIGKADIAVYESKRRGKNVVSMYTPE